MSAQRIEDSEGVADKAAAVNEVRLVGEVVKGPEARELPSGDTVWTLQVRVQRPPLPAGRDRPRQRVDNLDCAVWGGRLQKTVAKWQTGDVVEVSGALRRRFFQAGGATGSRVEIELEKGKLTRRAGSG